MVVPFIRSKHAYVLFYCVVFHTNRLTAEQRSHLIRVSSGTAFIVKVTVIDLDAKQMAAHRRQYRKQLGESQRAHRRALNEENVIDGL